MTDLCKCIVASIVGALALAAAPNAQSQTNSRSFSLEPACAVLEGFVDSGYLSDNEASLIHDCSKAHKDWCERAREILQRNGRSPTALQCTGTFHQPQPPVIKHSPDMSYYEACSLLAFGSDSAGAPKLMEQCSKAPKADSDTTRDILKGDGRSTSGLVCGRR